MAAGFDGTDDGLECADEAAFDWERTSPISWAAWIRIPANVLEAFMVKGDGALQRGFAFNTKTTNGPRIHFHITNSAVNHIEQFGPQLMFSPFLWLHVAGTYDGSSTRAGVDLYRNGVILTPDPIGADNLTDTILNDVPFTVAGSPSVNEFWNGDACGVVADNVEWTAAEVTELAKLSNFNRHPSGFLSTAPELWLPISAQARSTAFDLNDYANNHDATILGAPTVLADPAVALDWATDFGTEHAGYTNFAFTTTASVTHTPDQPVLQGVLVLIAQSASGSDFISGVTYGGKPMKRITFAADTAGEPGAAYAYFLGENVPQGDQTVTFTVSSGTEAKHAWIFGLLGAGQLEAKAAGIVQGDTANPSVTLATQADFAGFIASVVYSGHNAPASITPGTGYTAGNFGGSVRDFGTNVARIEFANKQGANVVANWTATSEDCAMIAVAVGVQDIPRNPAINHQDPAFL